MAVATTIEESLEKFTATDISESMDPRLQRIIACRSRGVLAAATASTELDEVAVIARVKDTAAWRAASEVRAPVVIAEKVGGDKMAIVTGRIPATRIEAVRGMPNVVSLKAGRPLRPNLAFGVEETHARPDLLPAGALNSGGQGVVVGVVDYGCDFAHRNFMTAARKTRLISIWHQGGSSSADGAVPYGREMRPDQIDAALTQPAPYDGLRYGPAVDAPGSVGSHGTHVMDISAGNGGGSGVAGFAPNADLIFVDVLHSDVPFAGTEVVGSSFGDSVQLLEAVRYIFDTAGTKPCVVNISLGTNGGPHDGSTLVEQGIDALIAAAPNRAVTISASNSYDDGIHAAGTVAQDATFDLTWIIPSGDQSDNEFELWYGANDRVSVELIDAAGKSYGTISPGDNGAVSSDGIVMIFAANRLADPNNGDNSIGVFLDRRAASGAWIVRLHGDDIKSGAFHAWIERDNVRPSRFAPPNDNTLTIGSISCGKLSIAVGSYDSHKPEKTISWFSSAGPTRDGRRKPEISAPGHGVLAAHSRTRSGVVSKSGTSMAAPAVAGIVALVMGEARARGLDLSGEDIREIVIASARRSPPGGTAWNDRYGSGRIDAAKAVAETIARAQAGGPVATAAMSAGRTRGSGTSASRRKVKMS